ncbi:hypothetical protein HK096_007780 [Nowakowskiella sp. JEL0078]|nr:hypothetical protein HK096_007780 [Nowakowskiella sp. JEL0078]
MSLHLSREKRNELLQSDPTRKRLLLQADLNRKALQLPRRLSGSSSSAPRSNSKNRSILYSPKPTSNPSLVYNSPSLSNATPKFSSDPVLYPGNVGGSGLVWGDGQHSFPGKNVQATPGVGFSPDEVRALNDELDTVIVSCFFGLLLRAFLVFL